MIKNILAVAIVAALGSACSSGSDSGNNGDNNDNETQPTMDAPTGTVTAPVNNVPTTVTPPGGGAGPAADTKAGSYIGTFGYAEGVYAVDNENQLSGLAIAEDGSVQSLFGQLGDTDVFAGSLRQYLHEQSRLNDDAISFGSTGGAVDPLEIDVTIVNGQTIESTAESSTAVALRGSTGSVTPASQTSLAGTWSGTFSFCNVAGEPLAPVEGECNLLTTELTFTADTVSGSTTFTSYLPDSTPGVATISGFITDFADVALVNFTWATIAGYSGLVAFTLDGSGDIAFVGENLGNPDNVTIAGRLSRQ
ncbi:MAG: hypothetical protein AB8B97_22670 [Granulosicoccus sp.]